MTDTQNEKPLFIPLNFEFWYAFRCGEKFDELRLYGPRWNEKTCRIGRKVVLSKGYGTAHRIIAEIGDFHKREASFFDEKRQANIFRLFDTLKKPIAQIVFTNFDRSRYPV